MEMKRRLESRAHSYGFPYVLAFAMLLVWNAQLNACGDDLYFASALQNGGRTIGAFLNERYQTWSSRILIEAVTVWLTQHIWLWRVLNALVMTGLAAFSARLVQEKSALVSWGLCAMVLLIPESALGDAGWIATQLNYTWPAMCALIALVPLKRAICGQRLAAWEALAAVPALLFAANQEQFCVALLAIFAAGIMKTAYTYRRMPRFCLAQLLITGACLLVIVLCPGNRMRYQSEVSTWFPGFEELTLLNKIEIGFSSTGYALVMNKNAVFAGFALLLATLVWMKRTDFLSRMVSAAPAAASVMMGYFPNTLAAFLPRVSRMRDALHETGTGATLRSIGTLIPDVFLGALFVCVVFGLMVALGRKAGTSAVYVLCVGLGIRMMLGFSPTIWASGVRTFVPLYAVLIALSGLLLREIGRAKDGAGVSRRIKHISAITVVLSMMEKVA